MAKHKNLSFFIPHLGCPHQCSFCDQCTISGTQSAPAPEEIVTACRQMLERYGTLENAEIAFFGGSFTAIPEAYQNQLLTAVQPFLGKEKFQGIRISTRPDAIDTVTLRRLQGFGVTAIELGAQSMSDRVLTMNERGHSAQAVVRASQLIRENFSLGLQLMVGLYGSTLADEYASLEAVLGCQPDTLRIYPTAVLAGTKLAEYWGTAEYPVLSWEEVLDFCADSLCRCHSCGVKVIRMGLHDSPSLRERLLGGYFHPAYREMAESRLYLRALQQAACGKQELFVETAPGTMSKLLGQKSYNRKLLAQQGIRLQVKESPLLTPGTILADRSYDIYGH